MALERAKEAGDSAPHVASCGPEELPVRFLPLSYRAFGLAPVSLQITSFFIPFHSPAGSQWEMIYVPQRGNHHQGLQRQLKYPLTLSTLESDVLPESGAG